MQPSTSSGWGRVLKQARWVAGILGGGAYVIWVGFSILYRLGDGSAPAPDPVGYVLWGLLGVGLILAIFKGIGEVLGGLALVGGAVWMAIIGGLQLGALTAAVFFLLPGVLFLACGWYRLAQGRHGATHATA